VIHAKYFPVNLDALGSARTSVRYAKKLKEPIPYRNKHPQP
jgi:hypothetical protein